MVKIRKKCFRITALFLICTLITGIFAKTEVSAATASVARGIVGDITWMLDTDGVLTFEGKGNFAACEAGKVPWSSYQKEIKRVVFQMGTVTGGDISYYFYNCSNLRSVNNIPSGIKRMEGTFKNCEQLTVVGNLPDSVTSLKETFKNCTKMNCEIIVPEHVEIGYGAFDGCTSLTYTPVIQTDLIADMTYMFRNTDISAAPKIPQNAKIMEGTFRRCTSLKSAPNLPAQVENMRYTFYGCENLTTASVIPAKVYDMSYCFAYCPKLAAAPVLSSASLQDMGYCFYECTRMENAPVIPETVRNMGYTFWGCMNMQNAPDIPLNVENMRHCLAGCSSASGSMTIYAVIDDTQNYECFAGENSGYDISNRAVFLGGEGKGLTVNYIPANAQKIHDYLSSGWDCGTLADDGYCGNLRIGTIKYPHLASARVNKLETYTYNGKAIKPEPVVYYGPLKLVRGIDYSLSYENNVNAGTACVNVTGMGDYRGTKSVPFVISKATFQSVKAYSYSGTFDGETHSITVVCDKGAKVEYGSQNGQYTSEMCPEYTLPGTYTTYFRVSCSNYETYTGSATVKINPGTLAVKAEGYSGDYDGNPHSINVVADTGAVIKYGVTPGNYTMSACPSYINAGNYTVYYEVTKTGYETVTGSGTIKINARKMTELKFPEVAQLTYGDKLNLSVLEYTSNSYGTFLWENSEVLPEVYNQGYNLVFCPNDLRNYDYSGIDGYHDSTGVIVRKVVVPVKKAKGKIPVFTVDMLADGDKLALSKIHAGQDAMGTLEWENPEQLAEAPIAEYCIRFTPYDTANFDWSALSGFEENGTYGILKAGLFVIPYPAVSEIVYGNTLGDSRFSVAQNGIEYRWKNPDLIPDGSGAFDVIMRSGDSELIRQVFVKVNKACPVYERPLPGTVVYDPKRKLKEIPLPSGWQWKEPELVPSVETVDYEAMFIPEDTEHYETVYDSLRLVVEKASPQTEIPYICGIKFVEGMRLSDIHLPSGWRWKEDTFIKKGKAEYEAVYTPVDLKNYKTLEKMVTVISDDSTLLPSESEIPARTEETSRTEEPAHTEKPSRTEGPAHTGEAIRTENPEQDKSSDDVGEQKDYVQDDQIGRELFEDGILNERDYEKTISSLIQSIDAGKNSSIMGMKEVNVPGCVKIRKLAFKKGKIKVSWKRVKKAKGYQIKCYLMNKKRDTLKKKNSKKQNVSFRWKRSGKCCVMIRAYLKKGNKKIFGKWSKRYYLKVR